jgi:hypothetical protein
VKRANPEHVQQVGLFQIVSAWAKQYPELALLYAVPNGSDRNPTVGAKLKAEGVRKGMLDCVLPVPVGGYGALYLEMKAPPGRASKDQIAWAKALMQAGNAVAFCWSAESAFQTLLNYLNGRFRQEREPWKRFRPTIESGQ